MKNTIVDQPCVRGAWKSECGHGPVLTLNEYLQILEQQSQGMIPQEGAFASCTDATDCGCSFCSTDDPFADV